MPSVTVGAGIAVAGAVGGIAKGIIGSNAARDAASVQRVAEEKAAGLDQGAISGIQSNFQPYIDTGTAALDSLGRYTPQAQQMLMDQYGATKGMLPGTMTQDQLEKTPGYQFNLSQGLKAVQNSAAARGLGFSGSAMRAAGNYATGLADSTYQNQFNNQQMRFTDSNNLLTGLGNITGQGYDQYLKTATLGDTAANQSGQYTADLTKSAANHLVGAGVATSAGITGSANAINNAIGSVADAPANYFGANKYFSSGTGGVDQGALDVTGAGVNQANA
jgi:hypothetical protein